MSMLITKTGKIIECNHGQTHEQVCWQLFKYTLDDFLQLDGGVRIRLDIEECAIECYFMPTEQQQYVINKVLRQNDIYKLTTEFRGHYNLQKSFNRPIRRLVLEGSLLSTD